MGALVFLVILFFFLACGALVFVIGVAHSHTRPYALSAALWCAAWGPCCIALILLAGMSLLLADFVPKTARIVRVDAPAFITEHGWIFLLAGLLLIAGVATAVAWLHQAIIDRLPFRLFRLYATAVVAGIGSVFGWCLLLWSSSWDGPRVYSLIVWLMAMIGLIIGFGVKGYEGAGGLRKSTPRQSS